MIRAIQRYFTSIPGVFTDGFIVVMIQMLTFLSTSFGTDEAAKYISPVVLFWTKVAIGELASMFLAIKMFRSTAFAAHQQRKANETQLITK